MKRILFSTVFLTALALYGQAHDLFMLKTALEREQNRFCPGEAIPFRMETECPADYRPAGWNAKMYVRDVPSGFAEKLALEVSGKEPQWRSIRFHEWIWFSEGDRKDSGSFRTTEQWPEGDYRISITVLFRKHDAPSVETDQYRTASIVFTLEK